MYSTIERDTHCQDYNLVKPYETAVFQLLLSARNNSRITPSMHKSNANTNKDFSGYHSLAEPWLDPVLDPDLDPTLEPVLDSLFTEPTLEPLVDPVVGQHWLSS
jgi:hypothetical protein